MLRLSLPLLAAALLAALPVHAQYALRADVISGGASEASGGTYALRGTLGQPVAGPVAGGAYALGQGFWYAATARALPPVDLTLTPLDPPPPVVLRRGERLRYRADFAIAPDGPSQFEYWAEATLPNQQVRFLFGPVVVNGTPGTTVSLTLQQRVPNAAPLGSYVFRMVVGAYPGTLYDDDSFPVSVVAGAALATHPLRSRSAVTGPASAHRGGETPRAASVGRRAAPSRVVSPSDVPAAVARRIAATPDAWLAWDEQGAILEAGLVQDLRVPGDETARRERRVPDRDGADRARSGFSAMAPSHATGLPTDVTLDAPFPNPAAGRMTLRFGLPDAGVVRMTVYNALGRRVARLIAGTRDAGWHEAVLDGRHLPRGVYSVRLEAGSRVLTCRATLLR